MSAFFPPNPIYTYVVPPKGIVDPVRLFYWKNPADALLNWWDWSQWLDSGETITGTPTVAASPSGLTAGSVVVSGAVVQAEISAGVLGQIYAVTCTIATTDTETVGKTFLVYTGQQ